MQSITTPGATMVTDPHTGRTMPADVIEGTVPMVKADGTKIRATPARADRLVEQGRAMIKSTTEERKMSTIEVGDRVHIGGHNAQCQGTVRALSVRGWPEGWSLVSMDGHLSDTIVPTNRLHKVAL